MRTRTAIRKRKWPTGTITICHIPPGNCSKRHAITLGARAGPSHQEHCAQGVCDDQGSCN